MNARILTTVLLFPLLGCVPQHYQITPSTEVALDYRRQYEGCVGDYAKSHAHSDAEPRDIGEAAAGHCQQLMEEFIWWMASAFQEIHYGDATVEDPQGRAKLEGNNLSLYGLRIAMDAVINSRPNKN